MNHSPMAAEQSGMGIDATPAAPMQHRADMAPSRVACGDCLHFLPDTVNPPQGVGRCGVTGTGPPSVEHGDYAACTHWHRDSAPAMNNPYRSGAGADGLAPSSRL